MGLVRPGTKTVCAVGFSGFSRIGESPGNLERPGRDALALAIAGIARPWPEWTLAGTAEARELNSSSHAQGVGSP